MATSNAVVSTSRIHQSISTSPSRTIDDRRQHGDDRADDTREDAHQRGVLAPQQAVVGDARARRGRTGPGSPARRRRAVVQRVAQPRLERGHGRHPRGEALLEGGEAALQVRLDRVARDPERLGDGVRPELVVVAQHEARALAHRELAQRVEHLALVLAQRQLVVVGRDVVRREHRAVTHRHQPAAVLVARQVEHDRAQVRRRPRRVTDPPGVAGQADEGLLDEVLGSVAVVDEQAGQAHERATLLGEEADDELVDVDRRHRRLGPRPPRRSARRRCATAEPAAERVGEQRARHRHVAIVTGRGPRSNRRRRAPLPRPNGRTRRPPRVTRHR